MIVGLDFTNKLTLLFMYMSFDAYSKTYVAYQFNPTNNAIETYDGKLFTVERIPIPDNKTLSFCVSKRIFQRQILIINHNYL